MKKSTALRDIVGNKHARLPENLADIVRLNSEDLRALGVSAADAKRITAAIRLAKEIAEPTTDYTRIRISSPSTAIRYCLAEFRDLIHAQQEEFCIVTLDTKNQPIQRHSITRGTLRNSLVHPREVFRPAIADAANCILVVHNHPSGDPTPSDQDISVTERLESAAEIIGIPVIDHIVVAGEKAISIQDWRSGNRW